MSTPSTPAGWYADPSGQHEMRYFDGASWTAQVADHGVLGHDGVPDDDRRVPAHVGTAAERPPAPWAAGPSVAAPPATAPVWSAGYQAPRAGAAPLASLGQRFGGSLLDGVLMVCTLFVGWLIWSCFTFSRGQTPAKSILGLRVVKADTGVAATWGTMFVRDVVIRAAIGILGVFLFGIPGIVAAGLIFAGDLRQTGWDRMVGTLVVADQAGATVPAGR